MLLKKQTQFKDVQLKMTGDSGRFEGYASVFDSVDAVGDTIKKGAFKDVIASGIAPKMFLNHDWDMVPIGKWTDMAEDSYGLFVKGELTDGVAASKDVYAAMKHGTLDGLSTATVLKRGDYEDTENGRIIKRWDRLIEVSSVTFPCEGKARLVSVKSEDMGFETVRDFERFLRDVGFSKSAAVSLVAKSKALFAGEPQEDAETERLLARLEALRKSIPV